MGKRREKERQIKKCLGKEIDLILTIITNYMFKYACSVTEDTTSGCKIKKNSDFPSTYAKESPKLFPGGTANDR